MKFTFLFSFSGIFFITFLFSSANSSGTQSEFLQTTPILCSSFGNNLGTCRGLASCTACTNCKYCRYCNSGGSCGVCTAMVRSYDKTDKKRKNKHRPSNKIIKPQKKLKYNYQREDKSSYPNVCNNVYTVVKKTSLREFSFSNANVLKRLKENEEVIVIETPSGYWWKVVCGNKVGWVKKHLLKEKSRA